MQIKRVIALLAAVMMLVCLFSACQNQPAANTGDNSSFSSSTASSNTSSTTTDNKKDTTTTDTPSEEELVHIEHLCVGNPDNYNLSKDNNYANLQACVDNQHKYGFEVDSTYTAAETHTSVLGSLAASGTLPDAYYAWHRLDDETMVNWIERGMILSASAILSESTGNFTKGFGPGGPYEWARAQATMSDGDWYVIMITNSTKYGILIHESDGPLRLSTQVHGAYSLNMRQDWLDKLGLAMPTNIDEFYDACVKMQDGDINGNGRADERVIVGLGSKFQYQGIGQWFGLPFYDFQDDPSEGHVEVGLLCPGFADWATYMNKLYTHQLVYANEASHPWVEYGNYIAENNVIAWHLMQDYLWQTGVTNSGDPNCNYRPLPVIQAVEGIRPRLVVQEANAAEWAINFNADTISAKDAAKMMDCVYSYEQWLLRYFGVEGKAWEYEADGKTIHDFTADPGYVRGDIENQYLAYTYMDNSWANFSAYFPIPFFEDLWAPDSMTYQSYKEALDAGEPYTEKGYDLEHYKELYSTDDISPNHYMMNYIADYGEENINWACYYSYPTLPTHDEIKTQSEYGGELTTYLQETATKMVIGDYKIADLQSYIDYARENLYMDEYIAAQQTRIDRFRDAIGM